MSITYINIQLIIHDYTLHNRSDFTKNCIILIPVFYFPHFFSHFFERGYFLTFSHIPHIPALSLLLKRFGVVFALFENHVSTISRVTLYVLHWSFEPSTSAAADLKAERWLSSLHQRVKLEKSWPTSAKTSENQHNSQLFDNNQ